MIDLCVCVWFTTPKKQGGVNERQTWSTFFSTQNTRENLSKTINNRIELSLNGNQLFSPRNKVISSSLVGSTMAFDWKLKHLFGNETLENPSNLKFFETCLFRLHFILRPFLTIPLLDGQSSSSIIIEWRHFYPNIVDIVLACDHQRNLGGINMVLA